MEGLSTQSKEQRQRQPWGLQCLQQKLFGRGYNMNFETRFSCNNSGRSHPGRGFGSRSFPGRGNFQERHFRRGRGPQQEQFHQYQHFNDHSDNSTLSTNQSSRSGFSNWDSHSSENFYNNHFQGMGHGYHQY